MKVEEPIIFTEVSMRCYIFCCLILFVSLSVGTTAAEEPVLLQHKFSPDQPLLYHHVVESHQAATDRFESTPKESDSKISKIVRVLPVEEKADAGFQIRLESIREPAEKVLERLKAGKPIEAGEFTEEPEQFLVSSLGKVRINEEVVASDQGEKHQSQQSIMDDSLRDVLRLIYVQLPDKPVAKGESWTIKDRIHDVSKKRHSVPDQPAREVTTESNSTLKVFCTSLRQMDYEGRKVVKVELSRHSNGTMTMSQPLFGDVPIPIAIFNFDVSESSGHFLFDPKAGKIITLELSEEVQINMMSVDRIFDLVMYEELSGDPPNVIQAKTRTTLELLP